MVRRIDLRAQTRSASVRVPRRRRCGYRPMSTISRQEKGNRTSVDWGTTAMIWARSRLDNPPRGSDLTIIRPFWGGSRPERALSRVDLPLPLGPRMPRNSPRSTWKFRPVRTRRSS